MSNTGVAAVSVGAIFLADHGFVAGWVPWWFAASVILIAGWAMARYISHAINDD